MDSDKVLALAREAGKDEYDAGMVTGQQFFDKFAALIQRHVKEQMIKDGWRSPPEQFICPLDGRKCGVGGYCDDCCADCVQPIKEQP